MKIEIVYKPEGVEGAAPLRMDVLLEGKSVLHKLVNNLKAVYALGILHGKTIEHINFPPIKAVVNEHTSDEETKYHRLQGTRSGYHWEMVEIVKAIFDTPIVHKP